MHGDTEPSFAPTAAAGPVKSWMDLLSGNVGGVAVVVAGHPLDTIKVRLQTQPVLKPGETPLFGGIVDCAAKTIRHEGFRGLYKGMLTPLFSIPPIYAVVFGVYGGIRRLLGETPEKSLDLSKIALAGAATGLCTAPFASPVELIKARLQVQYSSMRYAGPWDCAKQIFMAGGIREVFKGTVITAYRDTFGNAVYFVVYESIKRLLTPPGGSSRDVAPLPTILAGGIAGMCTWLVVYPLDNIKSRVQIDVSGKYAQGHRGLWQAFDEIRQVGWLRLYRGISPALFRAFPANAACFLAYETCMKLLCFVFSREPFVKDNQ